MALVTESWVVDLLLCLTTALFLVYRYLSHVYGYFESRGIPYLTPVPLVGHMFLFTESQTDVSRILYNSFPGERFYGFFQSVVPTFVVKDPELIHQIMVKDFTHFYDRGFPVIERDVIFSQNLFNLRGHPWRSLRNKLTPTFTSGKLKHMFDQFLKCGDHMIENMEQQSEKTYDVKVISLDFGTEVIASTAFGIDFSKDNPQTKEFVQRATLGTFQGLRLNLTMFLATIVPKTLDFLRVSMFKPGTMEYFVNLTKATKEYRKKQNIKRNDYFDLLMTLQEAEESGKNSGSALVIDSSEEDAMINQMEYAPEETTHDKVDVKMLSDEVLTGQTFVFLVAGSESISGSLSFTMYHVAKDPVIQRRLTEEIDTAVAKHGGWSYQAVKDMTYLDQVIQETLRLYPMFGSLNRECTLPYHIPNSSVVMEKGTRVVIPIKGLHKDPKFYPDPEAFQPERFANNNYKPNSTYMPFGDGLRICIAMRFAIVEMKVFLAKVFSKYSVAVNSKTQVPFVFDKQSFIPKPVGGIWLDFKRKNETNSTSA